MTSNNKCDALHRRMAQWVSLWPLVGATRVRFLIVSINMIFTYIVYTQGGVRKKIKDMMMNFSQTTLKGPTTQFFSYFWFFSAPWPDTHPQFFRYFDIFLPYFRYPPPISITVLINLHTNLVE